MAPLVGPRRVEPGEPATGGASAIAPRVDVERERVAIRAAGPTVLTAPASRIRALVIGTASSYRDGSPIRSWSANELLCRIG